MPKTPIPAGVDPMGAIDDRLKEIHAGVVSLLRDIADGASVDWITARLTELAAEVAGMLDVPTTWWLPGWAH